MKRRCWAWQGTKGQRVRTIRGVSLPIVRLLDDEVKTIKCPRTEGTFQFCPKIVPIRRICSADSASKHCPLDLYMNIFCSRSWTMICCVRATLACGPSCDAKVHHQIDLKVGFSSSTLPSWHCRCVSDRRSVVTKQRGDKAVEHSD